MEKQKGRVVEPRQEDNIIADPGTGVLIPVSKSGQVGLVIGSAGAETNTLAVPTFLGQQMTLVAYSVGTGTRVVTASARINIAANTTMTFAAAGDAIVLKAVNIGGNLRWAVIANDNVTLG